MFNKDITLEVEGGIMFIGDLSLKKKNVASLSRVETIIIPDE